MLNPNLRKVHKQSTVAMVTSSDKHYFGLRAYICRKVKIHICINLRSYFCGNWCLITLGIYIHLKQIIILFWPSFGGSCLVLSIIFALHTPIIHALMLVQNITLQLHRHNYKAPLLISLSLSALFILHYKSSIAVSASQRLNQTIANAPRDAPLKWQQRLLFFTTQFAQSNTHVHTHTQMASSSRISGLTDSPNNSLKTASCLRERRMWLAHSNQSHQEAVAHGKPPSNPNSLRKKIQTLRTASHAFRSQA